MLANARRRFSPAGLFGLCLLACFFLLAVGVWMNWWASDWWRAGAVPWLGPSIDHWFGTNMLGQDVFARVVAATATAFEVGLVVALVTVVLGSALGAVAGYYSNRGPDYIVMWLVGVIDSIPFYLFAGALAIALREQSWGLQLAMIATFWTTTARVVRAEVGRLASADFVQSARALGVSGLTCITRHIVPNASHLILVQATILFVVAIKTEVVLSFLGIGSLQRVSWGLMMAESAQEVAAGHLANFLAATGFLSLLVLSITLLADALQDYFDVRYE